MEQAFSGLASMSMTNKKRRNIEKSESVTPLQASEDRDIGTSLDLSLEYREWNLDGLVT